MVAITVIIATVAGVFVLGIGSEQQENATAGLTIEKVEGTDEVLVRVVSGGNSETLEFQTTCDSITSTTITDPTAGDEVTADGCDSGETITVVGTYKGEENVIRTYSY